MVSTLRTVHLPSDATLEPLPLLRVTWPTMTAENWLAYVRFLGARSGPEGTGVMVLRDRADYLCGLMVFEVDYDFLDGRILSVPLFTAVDLANSSALVGRLSEDARQQAISLGCGALQIRLYDGQKQLGIHIRDQGFKDRGGYLWARAEPAASP